MSPVKMILVFAPWLAFLVIAQGSLFRLKIGLLAALVLCIILGVLRIHRGIILWTGLVFFFFSAVLVIGFEDSFFIQYMGVMTSGFLGLAAWIGIVIGKPFTLDYAREQVGKEVWGNKEFIRSNTFVSSFWAFTFSLNAVLAYGKINHFLVSGLIYEVASNSMLIFAVIFTSWYTRLARAKRQQHHVS
ncbi:MAG: hypothetical protein AAGU21_12120 [Solidesulfovibrio sp.]|jgi:lysylphosphatidylglycerol synthetase-like protein (DUF2156 family)|uniref:hypothetical protein n=1 Tax=Solidesulfovibrio sp. TaxID=2910990 RepID=UPI003158AC2C